MVAKLKGFTHHSVQRTPCFFCDHEYITAEEPMQLPVALRFGQRAFLDQLAWSHIPCWLRKVETSVKNEFFNVSPTAWRFKLTLDRSKDFPRFVEACHVLLDLECSR